ncbi:MAG TPA: hydroxymethylglutaryl-CoA lyase [Stellaceae bacterium]
MTAGPFGNLPRRVRIRDMTLRDGLQSLPQVLPLAVKLELYEALAKANVTDFQVTSFMNPARVPQLADAEALWQALEGRPGHRDVLIANPRGLDRAIAANAREVETVISASAAYNLKNTHRSREDSMAEIVAMTKVAHDAGVQFSASVANCFHCFFEGRIDSGLALDMIGRLTELGMTEIGLADTTGYATPDTVYDLFARAKAAYPTVAFGAHLHDTQGRGLANAVAALQAGIDWFDAALAGLGGSPFTPGVGGNLSLEMLVDTLGEMGIATGIDPGLAIEAGKAAARLVGSGGTTPAAA